MNRLARVLAVSVLLSNALFAKTPVPPPDADLLLREIRYEAALSDAEARFTADVDLESLNRAQGSLTLFEGDVALLTPKLPVGLRIVREGNQYRVVVSNQGHYKFKLDLVAKITRSEPWNQVSFVGPAAAIASVAAQASGAGMELQMLNGTVSQTEQKDSVTRLRGFLGPDRVVSLRWQSKAAEAARKAVVTCETTASAQALPTVIKYTTLLRYEILQGSMPRLTVSLPAGQALTKINGAQIRDWQTRAEGDHQVLTVEFIKPIEKSYVLTLFSEQGIEATPFSTQLVPPQPLEITRESGSFAVSAEDVTVETESASGLRQVNATAGALAAYQFYARPFALVLKLRRIEPTVNVATRVTARLEEARLLVSHAVALSVEKAGIYAVELTLPAAGGFVVADVRGDGIEDWKAVGNKLTVNFTSRVLGTRKLDVQLEQALKKLPEQIEIEPLRVGGAKTESAQIGAGSTPGIRLKTDELAGLHEIPITSLVAQASLPVSSFTQTPQAGTPVPPELQLAYDAYQPGWKLKLAAERLTSRVVADVFNLVTIGDGLVGGSASVRYGIFNQGVQEFRVKVPAHWKNLEFTGPNIRRKELKGDVWVVGLQDKAWGGYTLVVTYDFQFDPHKATLAVGGLHALDVERETGSVAITSAANLQLHTTLAKEPLRRIDEFELAEADRALITRPVLQAFRYEGAEYDLSLDVTRFEEQSLLKAVADRTQLTTVLTDAGQMLTQASFMVKNNDEQFQRIKLPEGADFWSCFVAGKAAKAERDTDGWMLVPLPRGANRDEAVPVDIVYAQKISSLKSAMPRALALAAPRTETQTTYAEWELYVPKTHRLASFGGNMTVARGTTYGLRDAWTQSVDFYAGLIRESKGMLFGFGAAAGMVVVVGLAFRHRKLVGTLVVLAVMAILAGMLLPALNASREKDRRALSLNQLKQIGLSLKLYSGDNQEKFPVTLDELIQKGFVKEKDAIDPVTGQRFVYVGAGRSEGEMSPDDVLAYSVPTREGGNVLYVDGHVAFTRHIPVASAGAGSVLPAATMPGPASGSGGAVRPVVAGIRPIRIDLPRTGDRYLFTKVLNVRDEPLTVQAIAMETKAYQAARGGLEALAFVTGAALLWTQLRRKKANSFVAAVGVALVLGSVAHLLISMRWLHLCLIVAEPVLSLVVLTWTVRRLWERQPKPATNGEEPQAHPGTGEAGIPPVTAAIAVLLATSLFVNAEEVVGRVPSRGDAPPAAPAGGRVPTALVAALDERGGTSDPIGVPLSPRAATGASILSANYVGSVRDRVAEFDAAVDLAVARADQVVPLFGEEVAVEQFSTTSRDATLVRDGKSIGVRFGRSGSATVSVRFLVKISGDVTRRQIVFGIPSALSSRVALTIDEPEAAVEFPTAVSFKTVTQDGAGRVPPRGASIQTPAPAGGSGPTTGVTRVEAIIGAEERIEVLWTPRVKRATEVAATVFCQHTTLVSIGGGVIQTRALMDFQVTQGELRTLRVGLPAGQRLLRVEGDSIRTWDLKDEAGGQVLSVELLKGVSSTNYPLTVVTEKLLDALPAQVPVQLPHAPDAKRESGLLAISGSDELTLTVEAAKELQRVDAEEFARVLWPRSASAAATTVPAGAVISAYRFQKPEFVLAVRAEAVQPQIEATVRNRFEIGTERMSLEAQLDYTIKRAGVFALRLALPAGYAVTGVSGDKVAQWNEKTEKDIRLLDVALKERTQGAYNLRVFLVKFHPQLPKSVPIVGVQPLGVQKLNGFMVVTTEAGVQAKTEMFDGLVEIPATSLPEGPAAGGGLAFKFIPAEPTPQPAWKLSVTTEAIEPWVRAEVVDWLTLSETLLNGRALVRFEIANAPVKELRLRVPAAFKNVEITGPNIRRRDQEGEQWRVQLQNKVIGTYMLTVTWEQPWSVKDGTLDAAGVEALGVERETGSLAVVARPPLQVEKKSASDDLLPVDARELPEWAGRPSEATVLAYRYLRPGYKLALAAKRFEEAEVLQALVDNVRLTTVVADDGQMMTEMNLSVRNNARQFLEVKLPKGAQVWSAFVAGRAVRPSKRDGKLLLPLERAGADDAAVTIELTFVGAESFPKRRGPVGLESPALDVPLKNARWDLYLPPDYRYGGFEGTMAHELAAELQVAAFSLGDYQRAEGEKKVEAQKKISTFFSSARSNLASGKLKAASESYSQLRDLQVDEDFGDFRKLKADLRQAQAGNVRAGQQEVYAKNAWIQRDSSQPMPQQAAPLDQKTAERQWEKLQQAQELAVARVQPLRVNLPTHGVRHAFSQVLQTEVGKPMTVRFAATNTRSLGWPIWLGMGVAGFALLWALLNRALARRSA